MDDKLDIVRTKVNNTKNYELTDVTDISALVGIFTNERVPCDLVCDVADILSITDSKCHNSWFWGKTCTERRVSLLNALKNLTEEQNNNQQQQQIQNKKDEKIQKDNHIPQREEHNDMSHIHQTRADYQTDTSLCATCVSNHPTSHWLDHIKERKSFPNKALGQNRNNQSY